MSCVWSPSRKLGLSIAELRNNDMEECDFNKHEKVEEFVNMRQIKSVLLHCSEFQEEGGVAGFKTLRNVVQEFHPALIILPNGVDSNILEELESSSNKEESSFSNFLICIERSIIRRKEHRNPRLQRPG